MKIFLSVRIRFSYGDKNPKIIVASTEQQFGFLAQESPGQATRSETWALFSRSLTFMTFTLWCNMILFMFLGLKIRKQ